MKKLITLCCFLFLCGLLFAQQPPANATALVDNVSFASGMIVGDFDNDGDQDILTRALHNVSGNRILFENTGTDGVFQPPSFFAHEKENLPLALSDFDGDGDLDMAAGLGAGPFFYENDGNNNFLAPSPSSGELADIEDILAADLDGDGDPDLVGRAGNSLYWSENTNGQGLFGSPSLIAGPLPWPAAAMATADMDQNGTLDIVLCGRPNNDERPLLALFQQSPSQWDFDIDQLTPTSLSNDVELRLADLDGDGYPDVAIYGLQDSEHQIKIFANLSGAAAFQEVYVQSGVYDFALGDIDLDGDTDIAVQLIRSAEWLRNEGGFNWTAIDIPDDEILAPDIQLADMNQDGYLDLLQFRGDLDPSHAPIGWRSSTMTSSYSG
ncbi:MAG: VCBS repeat-containing protein [Lewinellaceae bacterium]|nr:VCBS repeat-containing protein [Phaeodactylibacter sp.]MCB9037732.1 VCBS repeat-containing protein [Lewinellaceae bacterium]